MAPRWGGLRLEPYKKDPPDADADKIVQEGTAWERPGGFHILDKFGREISEGRTSLVRDSGWQVVDRDGNDADYTPSYAGQEGTAVEDVDVSPQTQPQAGKLRTIDTYGATRNVQQQNEARKQREAQRKMEEAVIPQEEQAVVPQEDTGEQDLDNWLANQASAPEAPPEHPVDASIQELFAAPPEVDVTGLIKKSFKALTEGASVALKRIAVIISDPEMERARFRQAVRQLVFDGPEKHGNKGRNYDARSNGINQFYDIMNTFLQLQGIENPEERRHMIANGFEYEGVLYKIQGVETSNNDEIEEALGNTAATVLVVDDKGRVLIPDVMPISMEGVRGDGKASGYGLRAPEGTTDAEQGGTGLGRAYLGNFTPMEYLAHRIQKALTEDDRFSEEQRVKDLEFLHSRNNELVELQFAEIRDQQGTQRRLLESLGLEEFSLLSEMLSLQDFEVQDISDSVDEELHARTSDSWVGSRVRNHYRDKPMANVDTAAHLNPVVDSLRKGLLKLELLEAFRYRTEQGLDLPDDATLSALLTGDITMDMQTVFRFAIDELVSDYRLGVFSFAELSERIESLPSVFFGDTDSSAYEGWEQHLSKPAQDLVRLLKKRVADKHGIPLSSRDVAALRQGEINPGVVAFVDSLDSADLDWIVGNLPTDGPLVNGPFRDDLGETPRSIENLDAIMERVVYLLEGSFRTTSGTEQEAPRSGRRMGGLGGASTPMALDQQGTTFVEASFLAALAKSTSAGVMQNLVDSGVVPRVRSEENMVRDLLEKLLVFSDSPERTKELLSGGRSGGPTAPVDRGLLGAIVAPWVDPVTGLTRNPTDGESAGVFNHTALVVRAEAGEIRVVPASRNLSQFAEKGRHGPHTTVADRNDVMDMLRDSESFPDDEVPFPSEMFLSDTVTRADKSRWVGMTWGEIKQEVASLEAVLIAAAGKFLPEDVLKTLAQSTYLALQIDDTRLPPSGGRVISERTWDSVMRSLATVDLAGSGLSDTIGGHELTHVAADAKPLLVALVMMYLEDLRPEEEPRFRAEKDVFNPVRGARDNHANWNTGQDTGGYSRKAERDIADPGSAYKLSEGWGEPDDEWLSEVDILLDDDLGPDAGPVIHDDKGATRLINGKTYQYDGESGEWRARFDWKSDGKDGGYDHWRERELKVETLEYAEAGVTMLPQEFLTVALEIINGTRPTRRIDSGMSLHDLLRAVSLLLTA